MPRIFKVIIEAKRNVYIFSTSGNKEMREQFKRIWEALGLSCGQTPSIYLEKFVEGFLVVGIIM